MARRRFTLTAAPVLAPVLAAAALLAAGPGRAQQPVPTAPPGAPAPTPPAAQPPASQPPVSPLNKEVTLEVRAADTGEVVTQLSRALNVRMEVDAVLAPRRITARASKTTVTGFQDALASLYQSEWGRTGAGDGARFRLGANAGLEEQAERLREQRRAQFVQGLLQTADALQRQRPELVTRAVQADVARRNPYFGRESIGSITTDYLRQSLLLLPLRAGMLDPLLRNGACWTPFNRLPLAYQQLMASFFVERARASQATGSPSAVPLDPAVLDVPQARLEYKLLYGDRWAGTVLLARVGAADNWATVLLPSVLFSLPDDASLYPDTTEREPDPDFLKIADVKIDAATQTWDQALLAIAQSAGINVVSDSFPRPEVFRPGGPAPVFPPRTLSDMLDQVSAYYGYVWWKQGDWFVFRHRLWSEEERVSVPERQMQQIGTSLAAGGHLAARDLLALAAITDEQLLSFQLYGAAAGRPVAPPEAFDYNEIQLLRTALTMVAQMDEAQRELARGNGMPVLLMPSAQQFLFAAVANDRGIPLESGAQDQWHFRITDSFRRERLPAGWAELGTLQFVFDFGPAGQRSAELAVRAPARAPATTGPMSPLPPPPADPPAVFPPAGIPPAVPLNPVPLPM